MIKKYIKILKNCTLNWFKRFIKEYFVYIIQKTFIFVFLLSLFPRWMDELSNDKRWMISTKIKELEQLPWKNMIITHNNMNAICLSGCQDEQ